MRSGGPKVAVATAGTATAATTATATTDVTGAAATTSSSFPRLAKVGILICTVLAISWFVAIDTIADRVAVDFFIFIWTLPFATDFLWCRGWGVG